MESVLSTVIEIRGHMIILTNIYALVCNSNLKVKTNNVAKQDAFFLPDSSPIVIHVADS